MNLLTAKLDYNKSLLRNNVLRTVQRHPDASVFFFDDEACIEAIASAHSEKLATYYKEEERGCYRSDICRLAMLYVHGGLYFDNDFEVLADVRKFIPAGASLSSALPYTSPNQTRGTSAQLDLFQAFLAATPGHPVLKRAMDKHLDWYNHRSPGKILKRGSKPVLLGPTLLGRALREWLGVRKLHVGFNRKKTGSPAIAYLFQESINVEKYSLTKRTGQECRKQDQSFADVDLCNVCVVTPDASQPIAWSRIANGAEYEGYY
jgi:hypothetical protein